MESIAETLNQLESYMQSLQSFQSNRDTSSTLPLSKQIIDLVDSVPNSDQLSKSAKAKLSYYKGKALVITENYEKSAEDLLSKSLKLDPSNWEAWSTLGEIFYYKKDYPQAKRCFEGSLEQSGPKKDALRKLSIIYRFTTPNEDHKESVLKSIDIAKQALSLDFTDSESWYVLGNAHLTNYFTNSPTYEELEKSLKSYSQSTKYSVGPNPDLHFNKALALNAAEIFDEAFVELEIAHNLDPLLDTMVKSAEFLKKLQNVQEMIQKKCNMKKKNINALIKGIPSSMKNPDNFQLCSLEGLQIGANVKKMLSMKVLGYSNIEFPPVFVGCDCKGVFFAVSIYNYPKQSQISLGCTVFINEPIFMKINTNGVEYDCVQVRDPNNLMVQNSR
ncbi:hypothetical protein SteCoe_37444 [Stentor coeruleus]|uniref:Tetratricopeptide repeat protein 5 OB fold domain-containing protein n=1 Tax=Stentor coeruleus TaxID=5963 RepID=A0A1R2AN86_9CILI|nr:hypothetical protein SteCoe_37444 [Stentor coeruleus]